MTAFRIDGVILPDGERGEFFVADGVVADGPVRDAETIAEGCWVIPGLVDAHCHIGLGAEGDVGRERAREQALTDLAAGTMLIRDAGSPSDTRWVHDAADLPRLVRSGQHVARPKRYIRNLGVEVEPDRLVEQVRAEARSGDGWVKLVGDWIDRSVGDLAPLWPADVAADAIAAAHDEGARVTAHCFGEQSVAELVAAGIDCIEHGTGMSDEVIEQMATRGTSLVPTMINLDRFPIYAEPAKEKFPAYFTHMMDLHARRRQTIGAAMEAGISIYTGTDAGTVVAHGRIRDEVDALAEIGGAEFALGAASWRARPWLGADVLTPGASADLIVLDADPRVDLSTLRRPIAMLLRGHPVAER
ncbi:amidohydrolase family protein [Tessaracoccus flavus]|uniref:Amidohydrolase n=1 Tax=Tessaracoccus flavus TaxID=1610493 RepID=A0A1Q2CFF4_9ACTN|nr:amidohydrolase family protein [Tessaracoccus flavus]AQP44844.1 amidohydrolase [Tessaracoccus flavus]SDY96920.1 Pro-Hyp dipeptidase. Metallo peptidase. MEROPS family M38 [Tessaracoccus flavus]